MNTIEETLKKSEKVSKLIESDKINGIIWWINYCSNCNDLVKNHNFGLKQNCHESNFKLLYQGPNWYTTDIEKIDEINGLAVQYLLPFIIKKDHYWNGIFLHITPSYTTHAYSTPEKVFKEDTIISNKTIASVLADLVIDISGEY